MSQTFHPAEEGDFAPVKVRSKEIMKKATCVVRSDIPASLKTETIVASAGRLESKSAALNQLVTSYAANDFIFKSLNGLHDTFHEIIGLCSDEKKTR